jgi:hypothetical protein
VTETITTAPHSRCRTCGIDLPTPQSADDHRSETFQASLAKDGWDVGGKGAMGHTTTTLNPTQEERRRSRAASIVADALEDVYLRLDREVDDGYVHLEDVRRQLVAVDVLDGWDEWRGEQEQADDVPDDDDAPAVHPDQGELL